jgi:hypothetical protein
VNGPDTFPYFQLAIPDPGAFTPFSVVHLLDHVLQAGAGIVVHTNTTRREKPLWVFTYGSLVSYALFGSFLGDPNAPDDPPPSKTSGQVLRAVPDEKYLPKYARAAIGRFMRGPFQHPDPRIGLVIGSMLRPRKSLMVNLRLKDYKGDQKKLQAAMHYLTWFLPATYSVVPLPDDWPDKDMAKI